MDDRRRLEIVSMLAQMQAELAALQSELLIGDSVVPARAAPLPTRKEVAVPVPAADEDNTDYAPPPISVEELARAKKAQLANPPQGGGVRDVTPVEGSALEDQIARMTSAE